MKTHLCVVKELSESKIESLLRLLRTAATVSGPEPRKLAIQEEQRAAEQRQPVDEGGDHNGQRFTRDRLGRRPASEPLISPRGKLNRRLQLMKITNDVHLLN